MEKGHSPVQSIDRLFDIVEALSNAPRGMALSDLSAAVGLHTSTTHRLLAALVARGYVQKDIESGKYRLTMRLFEVGSRAVGGMNIVSLARPYLEHLAATTHEAIHLVVRDGDEVVYLYKENMGDSTVRMASFVGLRNPMYCTAVGKSILSCLPEAEVAAIWQRTVITRFTPHTIVDYADLIAELVKARQNGWAADREEHELGVSCIAAPLLDFHGAPLGAISVSLPTARLSAEREIFFSNAVCSCARAISACLAEQTERACCCWGRGTKCKSGETGGTEWNHTTSRTRNLSRIFWTF